MRGRDVHYIAFHSIWSDKTNPCHLIIHITIAFPVTLISRKHIFYWNVISNKHSVISKVSNKNHETLLCNNNSFEKLFYINDLD